MLSIILIVANLLIGFALPAAASMSSDNYRITTTVMSGGDTPMASANYQTNGTIGQPTPLMEQGMDPFSDSYGLLPGFWYTIGPFSATCPGDFDWDFDVDGSDLQEFIYDCAGLGLDMFAENFGKEDCP
jgi:hypothetical protein